jgi:hypothetical protein
MNLKETVELIESLKANGVKRFKSTEHEIEFGLSTKLSTPVEKSPQLDLPLTPAQTKATEEATKQIKDMISTLNLSPQQMADKMFADNVP